MKLQKTIAGVAAARPITSESPARMIYLLHVAARRPWPDFLADVVALFPRIEKVAGLKLASQAPQSFSTMYGTGMRVSEAVHLRMRHIDSHRMMIRIEQSKGNRDRDVHSPPNCWNCYAPIGASFDRRNGFSQDRILNNPWVERPSAKP
jgi:site-specific recombinase XerD